MIKNGNQFTKEWTFGRSGSWRVRASEGSLPAAPTGLFEILVALSRAFRRLFGLTNILPLKVDN
jgi:hypothetical protein